MQRLNGFVVWVIATVLLASALIYGHTSARKTELAVDYHCYLSVILKEGYYNGDRRLSLQRGVLEMLVPGSTINGFTVSSTELNNKSTEHVLTGENVDEAKLLCFEGKE